VSQTPVRDALNRLEKDGLVTIVPRRGYYIVELSAEDMEEIYDLRKMIEVYALESAIKNVEPDKLKELKQLTEKLQNEPNKKRKRRKFNELDRELHSLIVQSSPNKRLHEIYSRIYDFVKISQSMDPKFEESLEEHLLLFEAMLENNLTKAKKILMMHIDNAKDNGIKALENGLYSNYREKKNLEVSKRHLSISRKL